MKGTGRVYLQTVIDTYSEVVFAKLYDRKNALVAADMRFLTTKRFQSCVF